MWIEKLLDGVVEIITPIGSRYIQLTFLQRIYFLWIFRHFDSIPQQVLSAREQRMIDALCVEQRFISLPAQAYEAPIIGTLERVPLKQLVEEVPPQRPAGSVAESWPFDSTGCRPAATPVTLCFLPPIGSGRLRRPPRAHPADLLVPLDKSEGTVRGRSSRGGA
jgi:hypothetical protein